MTLPRLLPAAASLALVAGLLTACSASDPAPVDTAPPSAPAEEPTPDPVVEPEPAETDEPALDPTCDTIVSAGTVEAFTELGWTSKESEFTIGETTLDGGIHCAWSDWEHPSDHGQFFAWAPIDAETAQSAQQQLRDEGWIREDGDEGVYLTENPETAFQTDDAGYGITYLFGDGWVKYADTKQSLVLISAE